MFSTFRPLFPQQQEHGIPQDTFVEVPYFSSLEFSCQCSRLYSRICFKLMNLLEACCSIDPVTKLVVRNPSSAVLQLHTSKFFRMVEEPNSIALITEILFHLCVYSHYYYEVFILRCTDQDLYEKSADGHLIHPLFDSLHITPCSFTSWLQRVHIQDYFGFISSALAILSFLTKTISSTMLQDYVMRYFINFCAVLAYHRNTATTVRQRAANLGEQTIVACLYSKRMLPFHMHSVIIRSRFQDFEGYSFALRQVDIQSACLVLLWSGEVLEQIERELDAQTRNAMLQRSGVEIQYYYGKLEALRAQFLGKVPTRNEEPITQETCQWINAALEERKQRRKYNPFMKMQILNYSLFKTHTYPDMCWVNYSKVKQHLSDCTILVQKD